MARLIDYATNCSCGKTIHVTADIHDDSATLDVRSTVDGLPFPVGATAALPQPPEPEPVTEPDTNQLTVAMDPTPAADEPTCTQQPQAPDQRKRGPGRPRKALTSTNEAGGRPITPTPQG